MHDHRHISRIPATRASAVGALALGIVLFGAVTGTASAQLPQSVLPSPDPPLVETYQEWLVEADILRAAPERAAGLCQPLVNYVALSIPDWARAWPQPFYTEPVAIAAGYYKPDEAILAKRTTCLEVRSAPVVDFNTPPADWVREAMQPPQRNMID